MTRQISEPDWKLFRQVHPLALDRFCQRVLADVGRLAASMEKSAHDRYLEVFYLVQRRNKELAAVFNDFRRSTAWQQLALMRSHHLVTDEEFARFSPETQAVVGLFLGS
jgi:hypothetical protein